MFILLFKIVAWLFVGYIAFLYIRATIALIFWGTIAPILSLFSKKWKEKLNDFRRVGGTFPPFGL